MPTGYLKYLAGLSILPLTLYQLEGGHELFSSSWMKNSSLQCIIVIKTNVVFKIVSCCYYFYGQVIHMWQKKILKERCSEWVIRRSLYWITAYTRWKLDEDELNWVITFDVFTEESQFEFERLLNDYEIRESLQRQTGQVRASIIDNVLNSIDKRLAE